MAIKNNKIIQFINVIQQLFLKLQLYLKTRYENVEIQGSSQATFSYINLLKLLFLAIWFICLKMRLNRSSPLGE